MKTVNDVTRSPSVIYENDFIGGECFLPVRALIDPSSTHFFLSANVCDQLQFPILPMMSKAGLANREDFPVLVVCSALLRMNKFDHIVYFSVISQLICSATIGLDVLSQRESYINFVEKRLSWTFVNWLLLVKKTGLDQWLLTCRRCFLTTFIKLSPSQQSRYTQNKTISLIFLSVKFLC